MVILCLTFWGTSKMFSKAAEPLYIPNRALDSLGMLSHLPSKTFYYLWYPTLCVCVCVCVYKWKSLSHVWLFATPWAVAHQAPLSMEFCRQEYWSGWLFPSPGDLPNPGIEPRPPTLQVDSLPSRPPGNPLYMATSYIFFSSNFSSCSLLVVVFRFLS